MQSRIMMMADILGDWREELITVLPGELRIYTTTIPARDRRVCLMQDGVYRAEVAHRSMGYEQSPSPATTSASLPPNRITHQPPGCLRQGIRPPFRKRRNE
jgi:hypothetical protein